MKKYFCDVCGLEISGKPEFAPELGSKAAEVCGLEDLCSRCAHLSQNLRVSELVLAELRRQVEREAPPPAPAPPPVMTGRGAVQKRAILAALNDFRQRRGPGAIPALAEMSGVDEAVIRDMAACQKVSLADWRRVGKALGMAGLDDKEGSANE